MLDLRLAGAPCYFLLDSCEGACVDNRRVVVLNIVFGPLAVVCLDSLADAVGHIGFVYDGVAFVFLVCEDRANGFLPPYTASGRRRDLFCFEIAFDSVQALAG